MGNECKDDVFVLEGVQVATRRNETRVVNGCVGALHECDFVVQVYRNNNQYPVPVILKM